MNHIRDVTHSSLKDKTWVEKCRIIYSTLLQFLKHPIQQMKTLPDWPWSYLFITLLFFAISSKLISGFLSYEVITTFFYNILNALILMPVYGMALSGLVSIFLYYYFQIFEQRTLPPRQIFTTVVFSLIPFFIFYVGADAFQPIIFIGFAFSALLLIVGLVENFKVEKKRAIQIMALIYFCVLSTYLWHRFIPS